MYGYTATQKAMTRPQLFRYFGVCQECGEPATYGVVDNVALCVECASGYRLGE